jgi:hypothetical protein
MRRQASHHHNPRAQIPDSALLLQQRTLHSSTHTGVWVEVDGGPLLPPPLSYSPNCVVVPVGDLLVGKKAASPEDALSAFSSWVSVHGTTASYMRMALTLVDSHFSKTPPATSMVPPRPPLHQKRPRAESSSSYESGSESGQPIPALSSFRSSGSFRLPSLRGFTRGGGVHADPAPATPSLAGSRWGNSAAAAVPAVVESEGRKPPLPETSPY